MDFLKLPKTSEQDRDSNNGDGVTTLAPLAGMGAEEGATTFPVALSLGQTDPTHFIRQHFATGTYADDKKNGRSFAKGTTCLAFIYQGGVIVSVDSRASQGQYVGSQTVQKVIEINKQIVGTMAGGAADCLYLERYLGMQGEFTSFANGDLN